MGFPKVAKGYKRQWIKCDECETVAYYDYLPYSFASPVMTMPCGHYRTMGKKLPATDITQKEAYRLMRDEKIKDKKFTVTLTKKQMDILYNATHDQYVRAKQSGESKWARETLSARNRVDYNKISKRG